MSCKIIIFRINQIVKKLTLNLLIKRYVTNCIMPEALVKRYKYILVNSYSAGTITVIILIYCNLINKFGKNRLIWNHSYTIYDKYCVDDIFNDKLALQPTFNQQKYCG